MIKGIIFDFDGTLVHSERANIEAAIWTFKDIGLPLTSEEVATIPGTSSNDFVSRFSATRGIHDENEHRRLHHINNAHYIDLWLDIAAIFPDVRATVEALRKEEKMLAIATSNVRANVDVFFDKFDMHDCFEFVITGDDVRHRKPHPEAYLLAAARMHIPKEALLAVEDTSVGLCAAKAAGLRCAVVPNEYTRNHDFSEADFVLDSIKDVLSIRE